MRRETKYTKLGTVRTRTTFLWLPKTIYDGKRDVTEMRWLETATWEEKFVRTQTSEYWYPQRWL